MLISAGRLGPANMVRSKKKKKKRERKERKKARRQTDRDIKGDGEKRLAVSEAEWK